MPPLARDTGTTRRWACRAGHRQHLAMTPDHLRSLLSRIEQLSPRTLGLLGVAIVMVLIALLQRRWSRQAKAWSSTRPAGLHSDAKAPLFPATPAPLDPGRFPRTYRLSTGWRMFFLLAGLGLVIAPLFGLRHLNPTHDGTVSQQHFREDLQLLCLGGVALGFYLLAYVLRCRVTVAADAIDVQDVMTHRRLRRADILGRRTQRARNAPPTVILVPKDRDAKALKLPQLFSMDADFRDWLTTLPDLDAAEVQQSEKEVAANPAYGATEAERLARLEQARKAAGVFNAGCFALSMWVWIYPRPYEMAIATVALLPWIAVGLIRWSGGLYQFNQKRNSRRPDISIAFIAPSAVLALRAVYDIHILDWQQGLPWAAMGGLVLALLAGTVAGSIRDRLPAMVLLCLLMGAYAYGAALESDRLLDRSQPQLFRVVVEGKHVTRGRHTTWDLKLSPWGPRADAEDVEVSRSFYESVRSGQTVCIGLYRGALNISWFTVWQCAPATMP